MLERVFDSNGQEMAIIIREGFDNKGISFLTDDSYSQQLAYMHHDTGHVIQPHYHNKVQREVHYTQEVLVIKEGELRVDFYDDNQIRLTSRNLYKGDVILLCSGGHGFEVIEEVKMVEIKQGPYLGDADKTRFKPKIIDDNMQ